MIVCIAEKPSVARDIASLLGARKRFKGYIEGNGYQVTWTLGHLCTLKEPHDYMPQWRRWDLSSLPIIPEPFGIKAIDKDYYKEQLNTIKELLQTATMVINCGDAGQEGELIQRWVLQHCSCSVPVKRLWVSSLTDEALREGFANLKDATEYQSLYEAGLARAIGDWLLGMNATRLYTSLYAQGTGQLLSIGRVQTPTLALIVQRQLEIDNFKPEIYWELKTRYREVLFSSDKAKYKDRAKAEKILQEIQGVPFEVLKVKKKKGRDLPPRLFDLTSLQVSCNKKFAMTAEETLACAQSLYEKKITTYPRVDTTYLSEDIFAKVPQILTGLVSYRNWTAPLLSQNETLRKNKKVFDNSKITDHHAIIPTGQPVYGLSKQEQQVFDLIAKHFIACFYPDCEFATTTIEARVGTHPFKTSGKEILSPGWRVVFGLGASEDGHNDAEYKGDMHRDTEQTLPHFTEGEQGDHTPELKEKKTVPPKYYTEATLLRAMETAGKLVENEELREAMKENGIGRPSTRANIIETLLKRGYISKEKQTSLRATDLGISLIALIKSDLLKSAELTGQWEYKLRQIERKELPTATFVSELKVMVQQLLTDVVQPQNRATIRGEKVCPLCSRGYVIRGKQSYGCSNYLNGCSYRLSFEDYERAV